jgi:excisionase family DNA binding protein
MTKRLPQTKNTVSISEAAQILGVSLDTIRRWDKTGLLHSERPDGKNRYFSLDELKSYKLNQPLSISEASYELHISPTTLRRLVKKGVIHSIRNNAGERLFPKDSIKEFLSSDYYARRKTSEEFRERVSKEPKAALKQSAFDVRTNTTTNAETPLVSASIPAKTNWQLISGGLAALVVFVLLSAIGITNIEISQAQASQTTQMENVMAHTQPFVVPLEPKVGRTKSVLNSVELLPAAPTPATTAAFLRIDISEDGLSYSVESASASAQRIASPSANTHIEAFPIDSIDAEGYHLKLPDGSLGFIPFDKVKTETPKNE